MKRIGIIAAMNEEMQQIKNVMDNIVENRIHNLKFFEGIISGKNCVLVECGVGKVNAARTTQIMIDNYDIEYVVNVGTAGAIDNDLNVTDVVIGEKIAQHDFDITAFGHEKGYITGVGKYVYSDEKLINKCKEVMESIDKDNSFNVKVGAIASGDVFCTSQELANNISNEFNASCVEMEGAAIGQICALDNVPFIVIRSISDSPNGNNNIDFDTYLDIASKRGANFLQELLK